MDVGLGAAPEGERLLSLRQDGGQLDEPGGGLLRRNERLHRGLRGCLGESASHLTRWDFILRGRVRRTLYGNHDPQPRVLAKLQADSFLQNHLLDFLPVHERAVAAVEVGVDPIFAAQFEQSVLARDDGTFEHDVIVNVAADAIRSALEVDFARGLAGDGEEEGGHDVNSESS